MTEADESDGSFALLEPTIAVVTNIENDHLASDDELPELVRAFAEFLAKLPDDGLAVIGVDNALAASLDAHELRAPDRHVRLRRRRRAAASANLRFADFGSSFDVDRGRRDAGPVELRVPGEINVQNALAAIAVGSSSAIAVRARSPRAARLFAACGGASTSWSASSNAMTVVDDYAHHPTAVRATIAAARALPSTASSSSRFSRTATRARAYLAREFADALRGADRVYLAPVYAASEPAIPGVSERSIGEPLAAGGATCATSARRGARGADLSTRRRRARSC